MSDLSDPWNAYVHLQTELARRNCVDHRSWGLEAGLNSVLNSILSFQPTTSEEIKRAAASTSRQERHRARLRLIHFPQNDRGMPPEIALFRRFKLQTVEAQVEKEDWALLCAIAEGVPYKDLATASGLTPGNLRIRVLRLRRQILTKAAA